MFPLRAGMVFEISIPFPHHPSWPFLVFPSASENSIAGAAGIRPSRSTEGKGGTSPNVSPSE